MKIEFKVGDKVKHRYSKRTGTVVKTEIGCNSIYWVMFESNGFPSPMPLQDIVNNEKTKD
jgi:hypothetical protein